MDFITSLPVSEGYDEIMVIVDRFTKMSHFVPLEVEKKKAPDVARAFIKEV